MEINSIDVFCEVIDNYGDVGVAYRFTREIQRVYPTAKVRFIVDRLEEIEMIKSEDNLEILAYNQIKKIDKVAELVIETFGCNIPSEYLEKAYQNSKLIINLEYFSAEEWVDDFHLQQSILPNTKVKKFFYIPGLSEKSGGIIVDDDFIKRRDNVRKNKEIFLEKYNLGTGYDLIGSVFSYEKDFESLLEKLKTLDKKILLLIMSEKTQKNFIKYFDKNNKYDKIDIVKLPFYSYDKYEEILSLCDFNLVRGEDSFARALLLEKPFLWHIYPQEENVHLEKLQSFLKRYSSTYDDFTDLNKVFYDYNTQEKCNYDYFFDNLEKIENHNKRYSKYLIEKCNLINKFKNFIENLGG